MRSLDEARGKRVRLELKNFTDAGIGFIVRALTPSPVADLDPLDGVNPGMYMPFMLLDGAIRPHHECFNDFLRFLPFYMGRPVAWLWETSDSAFLTRATRQRPANKLLLSG